MSLASKQLLAIVGPTASGKTDVARRLAKKLPIELISCDSMQVYRSMPILTQASKAHLSLCVSPLKDYSAARFREEALALVQKITKKKRIPCFVGGTGLYLRAVLDGLFDSGSESAFDMAFRNKMLKLHQKHGAPYLHEKLQKLDGASAKTIHPNDARRLIRALEVFHLSGKPMSQQKGAREGLRKEFDCHVFFIDLDRPTLYERINRRVDHMLEQGLVTEVQTMRKKKLSKTAGMALGLREIGAYLDGAMTLEEALDLMKKKTRHYAKRQISWFRHEKGVTVIPATGADSAEDLAEKIYAAYRLVARPTLSQHPKFSRSAKT